jgi:hypothetical protein
MNARQLVAAVSVSTIMVNGAGFVPAGSAQPVAPPAAGAQSASQTHQATPSRLSYLDGDASFWRPGGQDWAPARLNTALAPGDVLYTGQKANVEIQLGPRAFVRAAERTQIGLDNQEPDFVQLRVTAGHAALDLRELPAGHTVELDTPNAAFTVERAGYYRVEVVGDSVRFSTHRGGSAIMTPASGSAMPIAANQQAVVIGMESPRVEFGPAPPLTAWDNWNYQRSALLLQPPAAPYVSSGIYGTHELDRYGTWSTVDPYGPIWAPSAVPTGWVPYSTGRWMWDPIYGWTWLDDAPWGWAPYHYGRWVFVGRSWAWAPGPVLVRPLYAPALVAFFGGVTVSVGRPLAWAPLGWGEPLIPWWGRPGFVGVPSWRGWGGPRVVNNVVIDNSSVVNVQNITVYKNVHVVNAVVGVHAERFGRERVEPARRLSQTDVQQLTPIRGPLAVRPVAASVMPTTAAAPKPPEGIQQRRIVSTRPPLDVAPMLRAHGLPENSDTNRPVAPRLVPSPRSTKTDHAATPPTRQESRPSPRDVPTPGSAVQRPADDGTRPSSPPPPKIVTPPPHEWPRVDGESPRVDRERRAVQTPPPPPTVSPSREAAPPNGARREAPPARVERPSPAEPPARRLDRAEPPTRPERSGDQRNATPPLSPPTPLHATSPMTPHTGPAREASPPARPQPAAPAPRVERPVRVEPPATRVERPARAEPPTRVEQPARVEPPAPRVERPARGEAQSNATPAPPRPTPPPQPASTREAPPPSVRQPEVPPARGERPAPIEPPPRQRPERADASKRVERSGDGAQQRQQ